MGNPVLNITNLNLTIESKTTTPQKIYLGFAKSLSRYTWIGLNDQAQEGSFIWSDETTGEVYTLYIF